MAAFSRRKSLTASASTEIAPRQSRSLLASAIRTSISDLSYNLWKFRDESWQRELWRFYDIIPEFGFAARWVGQCCSKVRIYVADVDKLGRVQGETRDSKINSLADTLLGGPAAKAEALRGLGINLTVAGECYIVGRPSEDNGGDTDNMRDEWYVLSSSEFRRVQSSNGEWQWAWYLPDGNPFQLDLKHNIITRVWTPHPARVWCADSPARSCQMILRELEQLTKYIFSQIDSRLIGAGILIIPNDMDLPADETAATASDSLLMRLATAGAASLRGEGSALGVLPHIVESDKPDGWKLMTFESQLSNQAMELRKEAVNRLGVGLDMPPEVLTGLGESNHWCLTTDTEIYTKSRSWRTVDQLVGNEEVLTLNHTTGVSEWQFLSAINVFPVTGEPMLSLEDWLHSSSSTRNHRWPVVEGGARIYVESQNGWLPDTTIQVSATHVVPDQFGLLALVPDVSEALGGTPIRIQRPPTVREIYDRIIAQAPGAVATDPPKDANWDPRGDEMVWFTGTPAALAQVEKMAILTGFATRLLLHDPRIAPFTPHPVSYLGVKITSVAEVTTIHPVDAAPTWTTYTGRVWCPATPNTSWLARRNGKVFYTGNSGFLIDGYGIKVHIEPLMNRICDALTKAYLMPALKIMGKDPARYTYAYDTSPLALRPQRLQDALNLYEKGLVNAQAVREAGYFKESEAPDVEEDVEKFMRELMLRDGTLLQNEAIRLAAGIPEEILSQDDMLAAMQMDPMAMAGAGVPGLEAPPPGQEGGGPPPPPPPPTGIQSELPPILPETINSPGFEPQRPPLPTGIQASAAMQRQMEEFGIAVLANATVRRGLEVAGKRLLSRDTRNRFPDTPPFELHTKIRVDDQAKVNRLLDGAWDQLDAMTSFIANGFDSTMLKASLERYCAFLLLSGARHDPQQLLQRLRTDGVIST